MPKTFHRFFALLIIFCLIFIVLLGCTPQVLTASPKAVDTIQPTPSATQTFAPVISKNATGVVIFSFEEDGYAHLFAYIPDELPLTRITSGNWDDIDPAPSPDGEKIAFTSNRSGFWDIYMMDISTGEITQMTNSPQYEGAPSFSPDGSFIAFEEYNDDNLDIVVGPVDDPLLNPVHLTTSSDADYSPAWAPDGRHIAFISNGDVILADLDKTDNTRFKNLSNTNLAEESHPVWSPDGKKLAWASSATRLG
jgi:TolB protein